jgi:hypothetical protein
MGLVLIGCSLFVALRNEKKLNSPLEWIIFFCGVLLIVLSNILLEG